MLCHELTINGETGVCPLADSDLCCTRRPLEYMFFVTRRGYCPDIDVYGDPEKQKEYEAAQRAIKKMSKQQKQRRNK